MHRANRVGFTLIELTAALSLTGFVLLGGRSVLSQLADARDRARADVVHAARAANGIALLRDLVLRAERSPDTLDALVGDRGSASFLSRCDVPAGWQERCVVTLAVGRSIDGAHLTIDSPPARVVAMQLSTDAELRYVDVDRQWYAVWRRQLQLPMALAVVDGADTMVVRVGVRP